MTKETLDLMHRCYQLSVERSINIMDIITNLYQMLSTETVPEDDSQEFDAFLEGLKSCIHTRYKTFDLTNLATDVIFVSMYIVIWLNTTKDMHIDINLNARRKSLESDLTKLLHKSVIKENILINDRFGLRGILLNTETPDVSTAILLDVSNYIIGILTKTSRKDFSEFMEWVDSTIDSFTKERIKNTLDLPFAVETFKDYVRKQKPNGYQSLHYILVLEMYSPRLPGAKLEFQLRTNSMHKFASAGPASHTDYKAELPEEIAHVFEVSDFSKVSVVGFCGYKSVDEDIDGVHFSKILVSRRISPSLVR